MDALGLLAVTLAASLILWGRWVHVDADAAFDGDPDTHTASERIKKWRRRSKGRALALSTVISALALIPAYLFVHLVLEAI